MISIELQCLDYPSLSTSFSFPLLSSPSWKQMNSLSSLLQWKLFESLLVLKMVLHAFCLCSYDGSQSPFHLASVFDSGLCYLLAAQWQENTLIPGIKEIFAVRLLFCEGEWYPLLTYVSHGRTYSRKIILAEAMPSVDQIFPTQLYKSMLYSAGSQFLKSMLCLMSTSVTVSTFKLHMANFTSTLKTGLLFTSKEKRKHLNILFSSEELVFFISPIIYFSIIFLLS